MDNTNNTKMIQDIDVFNLKKGESKNIDDYLSKQLVDHKTARDLKHNCEALLKVGVRPDIDALRYIKLALYEEGGAI